MTTYPPTSCSTVFETTTRLGVAVMEGLEDTQAKVLEPRLPRSVFLRLWVLETPNILAFSSLRPNFALCLGTLFPPISAWKTISLMRIGSSSFSSHSTGVFKVKSSASSNVLANQSHLMQLPLRRRNSDFTRILKFLSLKLVLILSRRPAHILRGQSPFAA